MTTHTVYWYRLALAVDEHGGDALSKILHDTSNGGLPVDAKTLYNELDQNYRDILLDAHLFEDQWDLLFPTDKQTHSYKFDITLKVKVIRECTSLFTNKDPKTKFVEDIRKMRNDLFHYTEFRKMPETEFDTRWRKLESYLVGLDYNVDMSSLKTKILDQNTVNHVEKVMTKIEAMELNYEQTSINLTENIRCLEKGVQKNAGAIELHETRLNSMDNQMTLSKKNQKSLEDRMKEVESKRKKKENEEHPGKEDPSNDAVCQKPDRGLCRITSNYRNKQGDVILDLTSYHSDKIPFNDDRKAKYLRLNDHNYVLRISKKYSYELQNILSSIYKGQEEIHVPDEITEPRHISSGNSIISIYSHTSQQPKKIIEMKPKDIIKLQWNQEQHQLKQSEWEDCCLRYLNSQSFNKQNVLTETIDVFTNTHTEVKDFVGRLKKMKTKSHFAIIGGYNPIEHYNLLYTPPFETKREGFQNFLVVLRQEPFEIWCLSMTYSEKVDDLLVEIQESCRRVELVALANEKFVESLDSKPTIYNVVVVPNIKTDVVNRWCCKFCYVMPFEIYNDVKQMESFFDTLRKCGGRKVCRVSFQKLASFIIGFVAASAGKIKIWDVTSHDLIQYTQLTNQQRNILSSCNKESFIKCFIKGDYGSGKTVLGLYLLKKIVESAETNSRVWYIAFVKSELLLQNIKLYLNQFFSVKNKDEDRKWCHQINPSITVDIEVCFAADIKGEGSIVAKPSHVITTLKKLHPNVNIHHFIFDEYDAEGLDRNEAVSLKKLTDEFTESYIIVLVHALEKFRTYHDGKSKIEHDKFKYSETGMTVYGPLITAMRNPKQIHELLTAAKKLIKFQENTFYHNAMENEEHTQPSISAQSFNNKETASKGNNNYDVSTTESTNQNQSRKMNSNKNASTDVETSSSLKPKKTQSDENVLTDVETSSSLKPKKKQSVIIEDVDIIASKFHDNNMEGNVKTTTNMFYHKSDLGNKIECEKKPVFVSFNWENDSERLAAIFIYFKYQFFTHPRKSALFICNKGEHQTIYKKILEFVAKKYILLNDSDEEEYSTSCKRLESNEEDLSIVCNTRSSSGCEFPNVVVCVHPEEHHLRHHFIDSVSRCTSYLTMLFLGNYNPTTSDLSDTTLHYIVKDLKENNLLEYIPLDLVETLPLLQDYEYDERSSTSFKINKNTVKFIELCKQSLESSAVKKNPPARSELLGVIKRMTDGLPINTKKDDDGDNDNGGSAEAANDGNKNTNADEDGGDDGVVGADEDNYDNKTTNVSSDFDSYSEADVLCKETSNYRDKDGDNDGVVGADAENDGNKITNATETIDKHEEDIVVDSCTVVKKMDSVQPFLPKEDQTIISESYSLQEDNVSDFTYFRYNYRLEILQQRFDVKLEFQGSKVQITGTTKNTQVVLLWFQEYERLKRQNDTKQFFKSEIYPEHMYGDYIEKSWSRHDICWSCIDFIPKNYIGAVIGKGGSNIKKLQEHFRVLELVVDCNIVLVKADYLNRHKIKTYFKCFKENIVASVEIKSIHYIFLIGIKQDEEVELGNKDGCSFCSNKCFEIVRCDKSSIDITYANIYLLEDYFTKVIGLLKRAAKNSIAVDMQVHHGKIHYTQKDQRRYQCHELVGMQDTRFSRDKWNHPLLIKSDICQKLIRYDFKIYSEDRNFFLRYKVFFKDSNGISTLKKNKALLGKFYNFEIGPGYFCIEEEKVAVIDVVDPNTNISSRFIFKKYQENTKNIEQITQAAESLRNVLEHLQNMDESEILEYLMKNLPEKYLLSFARRIDRTSYAISPKITLHSSEEVFLVDNCLPGTKTHNDVYLTHNTIDVRTADTSDILNGFLEILEAGSDIRASIVS